MPIVRTIKSHRFTTVPNIIPEHKDLSFKAKGLLLYLLSRPDGWTVHLSQLAKLTPHDSECSIRSAMKELVKVGFATFERIHKDGRFQSGGWTIYEDAVLDQAAEAQVSQNDPYGDFQHVVIQHEEKPPLLNTDVSNSGSVVKTYSPSSLFQGKENLSPAPDKRHKFKSIFYPPGFKRFWEAWPASQRKVTKRKCAEAWVRHGLETRADEIIATMTAWATTEQWKEGFDPMPLTWLNQCRYDDGPPEVTSSNKPAQRQAWQDHATHRVRRFINGPYCETCERALMPYEVPPKKQEVAHGH